MRKGDAKFRIIDGVAVGNWIEDDRAREAVRRYRLGRPGIPGLGNWHTNVDGELVAVIPAFLVGDSRRVQS